MIKCVIDCISAVANPCVLCPEVDTGYLTLARPDGEVVEVGVKSRATIVDASRRSQDGKDIYIANAEPLLVHVSCRKSYARKSSIISHKKRLQTEEQGTFDASEILHKSDQFDLKRDLFMVN